MNQPSARDRRAFLGRAAATGLAAGIAGAAPAAAAAARPPTPHSAASKPASRHTLAANRALAGTLPFGDDADFAAVARGRIAALPDDTVIQARDGSVAWNLGAFAFVRGGSGNDAPDTVNPSLWRQARLNLHHGLFEIADGIWQVRGYDISNMTVIRGETGWIVIDPLTSAEVATFVWQRLVLPHLGERPVSAVIFTHSHVDHFGGVAGIVGPTGHAGLRVVAPQGFMRATVEENLLAGNAMSRRATYMFGTLLPPGPRGLVDTGLGKAVSVGTVTLLKPTDLATETGQTLELDGVELRVLMAPESEAPAEFMFHLPRQRAFCVAEDAVHTMHNLYTLRGARVRDGLKWSKYLQQALDLFGADTDVLFASHGWPTWGRAEVIDFLETQRDMYRGLHDQTLRLANQGATPLEIAARLRLPPGLEQRWACRGYYGTVSHNARAQYDLRLGFFDGVPAHLNPLPPVDSAHRWVALAGGRAALLARAEQAFESGDYPWAAELANQLVFDDPRDPSGRHLLADAYEQLGYQAEAASWRNIYLAGAQELRLGVRPQPGHGTRSAQEYAALDVAELFDDLGVRLDASRAGDSRVELELALSDSAERHRFGVAHGALHHGAGATVAQPDASLTTDRSTLDAIVAGSLGWTEAAASGRLRIDGDAAAFGSFMSWIDSVDLWFDIVTP